MHLAVENSDFYKQGEVLDRDTGNCSRRLLANKSVKRSGASTLDSKLAINMRRSSSEQNMGSNRMQTYKLTSVSLAVFIGINGQILAQGPSGFVPAIAVSTEAPANVPPRSIESEFEPAKLVAIVGEEHVLASELMQLVEPKIAELGERIPESQVPTVRAHLMRQALIGTVTTKMLSQEYIRQSVGGKAVSEKRDARDQFTTTANRIFHETYIPQLMQQHKAQNEIELNEKLKSKGTSIEGLKLTFLDGVMADEMLRKVTPEKLYVDILEVRDRYESQKEDWRRDARARFQVMTVRFSKFPNKQAAYQEIQSMYEEVRLGGAKFESVAKRRSQGARADEGGLYDWTSKGALVSEVIDELVFTIPLNRLSNIVEDKEGFHFAVVLEREEARVLPFADAQEEIRKKVEQEKKEKVRDKFLEKLRKETVVWTLWPEDIPGSRPLSEAVWGQTAGR